MPAPKFMQAVRRPRPSSPTHSHVSADVRSMLGVGEGRIDDRPALSSVGVLQPIARRSERPPPSSYHAGPSRRRSSASHQEGSTSSSRRPSESRALVPAPAPGLPARRASTRRTEPRGPMPPPTRRISYRIVEPEPGHHRVDRNCAISHTQGHGSTSSTSYRTRTESYGGSGSHSGEPAWVTQQRRDHMMHAREIMDSVHGVMAMPPVGPPRMRRGTASVACCGCCHGCYDCRR